MKKRMACLFAAGCLLLFSACGGPGGADPVPGAGFGSVSSGQTVSSQPEASVPEEEASSAAGENPGSSEEQQMVSGSIVDAAMNNIVIETGDGRVLSFATAEADKSDCRGLLIGSTVRLYYTGVLDGEDTSNVTVVKMEQDETFPSELVTNSGALVSLADLEHCDMNAASTVFYTSAITPEAMLSAYEALGWSPTGKVAVKLSTGEPPASNYLDPSLIKDLVQLVDGTIVECNTAYGGSRASTALHKQVAEDHGFTAIAPVDILDENGSLSIPVTGGVRLSENFVGASFSNYDSYLVLSHFKGHQMAGFGGAIKNISIGLGSSEGKGWIHSGGTIKSGNIFGGEQNAFLEAMAEAGKAVSDYLGNGERIVYINVMNRISIDCDCDGNPAEPDIHDIGIMASTDPVALDQACIDLVSLAEGSESLMNRIEGRNGLHTLAHAETMGLGSRVYKLTVLDR